jgi:PAS domain S-box-containing protein
MKPKPIQKESEFLVEELFFSTTDPRGVITTGDALFQRISKYSRDDLLGSPHNVIRHPDMPRVVFRLLWETIQAGQPISAYVKNLAKDGSYYWVLATVFPIEGGYLSIRIKPTSPVFSVIPDLYNEILKRECEAGMDAAQELLLGVLREKGFEDYPSFVSFILAEELRCREVAVKRIRESLENEQQTKKVDFSAANEGVLRLKNELKFESGRYASMFQSAEAFHSLHSTLGKTINDLVGFLNKIDTLATNTAIATARVGKELVTLETIAAEIQKQSKAVLAVIGSLQNRSTAMKAILQRTQFWLAGSYLQNEMMLFYVEVLGGLHRDKIPLERQRENLETCRTLARSFLTSNRQVRDALGAGKNPLKLISSDVVALGRLISALEMVQKTGTVESARSRFESEAFLGFFAEMRTLIEGAKKQIRDLSHLVWETSAQIESLEDDLNDVTKVFNRIENQTLRG